MKYIKT